MIKKYSSRTLSRLSGIQAIYQKNQTDENILTIVSQFENYHFSPLVLQTSVQPDYALFCSICKGVDKNYTFLKEKIVNYMNENWQFDRLPQLSISILLCAIYEIFFEQTPKKVIINEYISLSKSFLDLKETQFINAILDKIVKDHL